MTEAPVIVVRGRRVDRRGELCAVRRPGGGRCGGREAHRDHFRGVATALLQRLAGVSRRTGIQWFTGDVLAENGTIQAVLDCTASPKGA
jgi:hypothetical protein